MLLNGEDNEKRQKKIHYKQLVAYKIFRFNHIIFLQDISINKANDLVDDKNSDD